MIKHKTNEASATSIRKILACGGAYLWALSAVLLPLQQARAHLGPAGSGLTPADVQPYNPLAHNSYLIGVDKIVVWANHPADTEYKPPAKIPKIDFTSLNQKIVDQLRADLPKEMKRLQVETIFESALLPNPPNDEHALTLNFRFGYHVVQHGQQQVIIGAVYPSIERLPPTNLRQDRVSGVLSTKFPPAPFLIEGDEAAINKSVLQATQRCVSDVVEWLKLLPLEMPEQGNGSTRGQR